MPQFFFGNTILPFSNFFDWIYQNNCRVEEILLLKRVVWVAFASFKFVSALILDPRLAWGVISLQSLIIVIIFSRSPLKMGLPMVMSWPQLKRLLPKNQQSPKEWSSLAGLRVCWWVTLNIEALHNLIVISLTWSLGNGCKYNGDRRNETVKKSHKSEWLMAGWWCLNHWGRYNLKCV